MDAVLSSGRAPCCHPFLDCVEDHLPQEAFLDLPILAGEELYEVAMAKKSTAGVLDGWAWNEIRALSLSWFVGLALVLRQSEATGRWPQGLLDAYIAMIPKAAPLVCLTGRVSAVGLGSSGPSSGLVLFLGS